MQSVVKEFVMNHIAILSDAQHGFVLRSSCLTYFLPTEQWVTTFMDAHEALDVVFLDFARTFDLVHHRHCCIKLDAYEVHSMTIEWSALLLRIVPSGFVCTMSSPFS